jgi:anti-anti-sigma factor
MLDIGYNENGDVALNGRLDASQAQNAAQFLDAVEGPCVLNLEKLEYISSAGLGVLLATQQRLVDASGAGLRLVKLNKHVSDVFRIAGFDKVFEIDFGE